MQTDKINSKTVFNLADYESFIDSISRIEYSKITAKHLIDFEEVKNIAIQVIHKLCSVNPDKYNKTYLSTAIKWTVRNELRRRYKWYSQKNKTEMFENSNPEEMREAVYKTILSIDEMAEAENPTIIKDTKETPEEKVLLKELKKAITNSMKNLSPREKELIEAKFFKDKKLKDISNEFNLSPSRISRIIQSALNKVKKDLQKKGLV